MKNSRPILTAMAIGLYLLSTSVARAQMTREWATAAVDNVLPTDAVQADDRVFFAAGKYVHGLHLLPPVKKAQRTEWPTEPIGPPLSLPNSSMAYYGARLGGYVRQAPIVAQLQEIGSAPGLWHLFATSDDGYISALNPETLEVLQQRKIRRAACAQDTLVAAPTWRPMQTSGPQKTLVFVATHHGCGDNTGNQVWALDASDISQPPVWIFNVGDSSVPPINGCRYEQAVDTLFCGSEAMGLGLGTANTLWAIDASSGQLKWANAAGPLRSAPAIGFPAAAPSGRVYAADTHNRLRAFDLNTGALAWERANGVASPSGLTTEAVWTSGSGSSLTIYSLDTSGYLRARIDQGSLPDDLWSWSGVSRAATFLPVPHLGKGYVGLANGSVAQLNLTMGTKEAVLYFTTQFGDGITNPIVFGFGGEDHLVAAAHASNDGARVLQYHVPCPIMSVNCVVPPVPPPAPSPPPVQVVQMAPPPQTPHMPPPPPCARAGNTMRVMANVPWCDTRIKLATGQRVTILAAGRWSNSGPPTKGPEGFVSYKYPGTVLASADLASLIAKVGPQTFQVGAHYSAVLAVDGHLYLGMNDAPDSYGDNQGYIDAKIDVY